MSNLRETVKLSNGVEIPRIGFGTFKIDDGDDVKSAVLSALKTGYRHIDTAAIYGNEKGVGEAIRESGIARNELFVTSKLWNSDQGYESTLRAFDKSLELLGMDYLDLYLIHWPKAFNKESWRALIKLYNDKRVRAVGVSNFKGKHLDEIIDDSGIVPMVNQVELHPRFNQKEIRDYCAQKNIVVEAWGPLMQGKIFSEPLFIELAEQYGKTIAQVALRWHYQLDVVTLPKSVKPERMQDNVEIFDFSISDGDMNRIAALSPGRVGPDPDTITF
ncbi:MAG: aldo/keto reductase [Bacteroidetes bacterium]|nr:aldo/keto reductase [Bacteroidota bacterium]